MKPKRCCRSCNHYVSSNIDSFLLCKLRKLKIHSDIASCVFCHHWIIKEPHLPNISKKFVDQQLDFGKELILNEN
tara:strand:+ start:571 stop:795 length:225 start_codon:yes stop_codon:yes gene_type:complete